MTRKPCVYKNVAMQMFMNGITINSLAKNIHVAYKSLCRKLNGETAISVEEAIAIHEFLNKPMPIEHLFSRE